AVWMRRGCLGGTGARSGELPTLAPPLLRQLAALGDNPKQTTGKGNSGPCSRHLYTFPSPPRMPSFA
ncbi:hypothetical protein JQN47_26420, partial [Escherichia coli]|nr:hypothetical protein [Escherichia coli]